jgi:hypothetical protein
MASEPSGISGLWFVESQSLNCGRYVKGLPYGARALIVSLPVICFTVASSSSAPASSRRC